MQTIQSVRSTADIGRTMEGTVQGTLAYMPPEQARGQIDLIDAPADI